MKRIITKDGSTTFFNEEYQEYYHSASGAIEEAQKKFIEPSSLMERSKTGQVSLLDICFGLGYKSLMAIHTIRKADPTCKINIVALEKDMEIIGKVVEVPTALKEDYLFLRDLVSLALQKKTKVNKGSVSFAILVGDAKTTIKSLDASFDVISLDPFSPKKNPDLWTLDFFKEIFKRSNKGAVLTTYSCASSVRKNLRDAGFLVKDGPCLHRRGPSTVAIVQ